MNSISSAGQQENKQACGTGRWSALGILCSGMLVGLGGAGPVAAQSAAAPADAATQPAADLEEIVVTATRRSEGLSKVPVSVTALSQESMDARGIKDFQDIARFTPGVNIDNTGTNAISIRGISSSGGAGTTGIYIDDTPIQMRAVGFNPDDTLPKTFDLDRVEVLRGPQGTLFGAGSEGGTVRYILTQPKLTGSSTYARAEVSASASGGPSSEIGIAHGMALIDGTLGIRASAWYRFDGGWINRIDPQTRQITDRNSNSAKSYMLRLAAVWQPISTLTLTPSVIYQNSRKNDESTYWPAYSNPGAGQFNNATPETLAVPDKYLLPSLKMEMSLAHSQIIGTAAYYSRDEQTAYQGTVYDLSYYQSLGWTGNPNTGGLGCGSASPIATAAPCDWYPLIDGNGIHIPAGFPGYNTPNTITNAQRSWTAELRWQSTDDTSRWRWTIGAFFQQSKERSLEELKDSQINQLFLALYGQDAISVFGDFYHCNGFGTYTAIPDCDIYYNSNSTTDRQLAAFGELGYAITDQLRITFGERVAHTEFSIDHYANGLENFGPGTPPIAHGASSETPNTPKLTLSYQHDPSNLYYATYAKGFRVGGGNAPLPSYCATDLDNQGFPNGAPLVYQSDSTQSYELGSKNSFGRALRIATSVYYIKWHNIQQNVYIGGGCGLQFTDNLGEAVAQGADIQAELNVGPMKFEVAAGYTDARYSKSSFPPSATCPSASSAPCLPLANVGDGISGEESIELSPGLNSPWTAAVGVEYGFRVAEHPAFLRFDYEYQARNHWLAALQDATSQFNPGTYSLPSTVFAQLRGGVTLGSWSVSAFIDNLFDSHTVNNYQLGQIDAYVDPGLAVPSEQQNQYTFRPRTYGLTTTYHL